MPLRARASNCAIPWYRWINVWGNSDYILLCQVSVARFTLPGLDRCWSRLWRCRIVYVCVCVYCRVSEAMILSLLALLGLYVCVYRMDINFVWLVFLFFIFLFFAFRSCLSVLVFPFLFFFPFSYLIFSSLFPLFFSFLCLAWLGLSPQWDWGSVGHMTCPCFMFHGPVGTPARGKEGDRCPVRATYIATCFAPVNGSSTRSRLFRSHCIDTFLSHPPTHPPTHPHLYSTWPATIPNSRSRGVFLSLGYDRTRNMCVGLFRSLCRQACSGLLCRPVRVSV